jgi:hypothetical protein
MLSSAEIARGSQGAIKFLARDVSAPSHFENTAEACLRSFQVMILVAPIYGLYLVVHYMQIDTTADEGQILLAEGLRFVVDWLLYPVIFYEIARRRGWLDRYPRYIAALNWINLPAAILLLIATAVGTLLPPGATALLLLVLQILFFYWFMVTTRLALGVDVLFASLLLAVNWLPSYLLSYVVNRFLGVGFGG